MTLLYLNKLLLHTQIQTVINIHMLFIGVAALEIKAEFSPELQQQICLLPVCLVSFICYLLFFCDSRINLHVFYCLRSF